MLQDQKQKNGKWKMAVCGGDSNAKIGTATGPAAARKHGGRKRGRRRGEDETNLRKGEHGCGEHIPRIGDWGDFSGDINGERARNRPFFHAGQKPEALEKRQQSASLEGHNEQFAQYINELGKKTVKKGKRRGKGKGKKKKTKRQAGKERFDHKVIHAEVEIPSFAETQRPPVEPRKEVCRKPTEQQVQLFNDEVREGFEKKEISGVDEALKKAAAYLLAEAGGTRRPDTETASSPIKERQNEIWEYLEANPRTKKGKPAIRKRAMAKKFAEVGNTPAEPGETETPADKSLLQWIPKLAPQLIEKLEEEISSEAAGRVLRTMKQEGATDPDGNTFRPISFLDEKNMERFTEMLNETLRAPGGPLSNWPDAALECRNSAMFKKGDPTETGNYRYVATTRIIPKILMKVLPDRLYTAAEAAGLFEVADHFQPLEGRLSRKPGSGIPHHPCGALRFAKGVPEPGLANGRVGHGKAGDRGNDVTARDVSIQQESDLRLRRRERRTLQNSARLQGRVPRIECDILDSTRAGVQGVLQ